LGRIVASPSDILSGSDMPTSISQSTGLPEWRFVTWLIRPLLSPF
jgi:hypothetical protein